MKAAHRFLILALLSFLAGCSMIRIADLITQSGGILYQDDFSNPASGWARTLSKSGVMDYDSGTYRMLVLVPNYDLRSLSGRSFRDVRVEAGATRLDGPPENRFGLVCRYVDGKNYYFFIISSDGFYAIGKVGQGVQSLLGQSMMAYNETIVKGAGPNRLRFDCVGRSLSAFVNDRAVASVQDADFPQGDVGLLVGTFTTGGADVAFDHFVVLKP